MATFHTVQIDAPTSTGAFDFTHAGVTDPKGGVFWLTRSTSPNPNLSADCSEGYIDGTAQLVTSLSVPDASTGSRYIRRATDECVMLISPTTGAVLGEAAFSSFITTATKGIRLNCTTAFPAGYKITGVIQSGGQAKVLTSDSQTWLTATETIVVGFQPTGVRIQAAGGVEFTDVGEQSAAIYLGFAAWDKAGVLTQVSHGFGTVYNAGEFQYQSSYSSDETAALRTHIEAGLDDYYTASNRTGTGFDLTGTYVSGNVERFGMYCWSGAPAVAKIEKMDLNATASYTGYGTLTGLFFGTSTAASKNSHVNNALGGSCIGWGFSESASVEFGHSIGCYDGSEVGGAGPYNSGDCKSGTETRGGLALGFTTIGGGTDRNTKFDMASIDADGFTINQTATVGAYFLVCGIQEDTSLPDPTVELLGGEILGGTIL